MNFLRNLAAAAALAGLASTASAVDGLVVFGDSLSDTGNVAALVGSNPAQVITGNTYIPSQPYASGQFTNGDVWVKTFANAIGLGSFAGPWIPGTGSNFAFGGARVTPDSGDQPPSLQTQQGMFLGNAPGNVAPSSFLYVIEGGGNDARDALAAAAVADPVTAAAVIAFAANTYAQEIGAMVDQLQAAGGQDIVVWNVPNLALAPAVTAQGAGASFLAGLVAQAMNTALAARLALESDVLLFDLFGFQNSIAADPGAFGLSNVSDACGAAPNCDPSTYLFWDGIHPTSAGHALLAQEMLEQTALITAVPEPETYALMLAGLGAVAMLGRRKKKRAAVS